MLEKLNQQQLIEIINKQKDQLDNLRAQREVFKKYLQTVNKELTEIQKEREVKKSEKINFSDIWEQLDKYN